MSFQNLTWPQVALCLGLIVATLVVQKLFGEAPANVAVVLSCITNLLIGRTPIADGAKR